MISIIVSYAIKSPFFLIPYGRIVLMTDPAVAYTPDDKNYGAYHRGKDLNIYLKAENGSDLLSLVWPG